MRHEFQVTATSPASLGVRIDVACSCGEWKGIVYRPPGIIAPRDLEGMKGQHFEHAHGFDKRRGRNDY